MEFFQRTIFLFSFLAVARSLPSPLPIYWAWGGCPKATTKPDFQVQEYLGTWYEIVRYPAPFESFDDRCTQAVYTPDETRDNYIGVKNSGIRPDGSVNLAEGTAWIPDANEPGKLKVTFSIRKYFRSSFHIVC